MYAHARPCTSMPPRAAVGFEHSGVCTGTEARSVWPHLVWQRGRGPRADEDPEEGMHKCTLPGSGQG